MTNPAQAARKDVHNQLTVGRNLVCFGRRELSSGLVR